MGALLLGCSDSSGVYAGHYRSVSESEWQLGLKLEIDGSAHVALETWEAGSETLNTVKYVGSWTASEIDIELVYDSSVATLQYAAERSFREFGCSGHAPAVVGTGGSGKHDLFEGVTLWAADALDARADPC